MTASLAVRLGRLPVASRRRVEAELGPLDFRRLLHAWRFWARPEQLAPAGSWGVWLILAGRGFGKTRSGAEWVRWRIEHGAREVALIGPTMGDIRDTVLGDGTDEPGEGFLNVWPPEQRPIWLEQKRRVEVPAFPNVRVRVHTAEEPEFRGPNTDTIWGDEIRKWRYLEDLWPNIEMTLRKPRGLSPAACLTTTPSPSPTLDEIKADPDTVITRGNTFENAANLDPKWLRKMARKYAGTKLGLAELFAKDLDAEDMLFAKAVIDKHRVAPLNSPKLRRVVIAVDPGTSQNRNSDDTGIVAAGEADGHVYVLDDRSGKHSPEAWGLATIEAFVAWGAEAVVVERNAGGDLVRSTLTLLVRVIETAPEHERLRARLGPRLSSLARNIIEVHSKDGKKTRAEPVSAAYQQGRVHHVGRHAALEQQLVTFDPLLSSMANKDRFDALVHAVWELLHLERGHVERHGGAAALEPTVVRLAPKQESIDSGYAIGGSGDGFFDGGGRFL